MANVSSSIGTAHYRIEITSPTGNVVVADEPISMGGKDSGFSPKELLAAALAACTSATLRMYADRKQWPLEEVRIDINLERDESTTKRILIGKLSSSVYWTQNRKKDCLLLPMHVRYTKS